MFPLYTIVLLGFSSGNPCEEAVRSSLQETASYLSGNSTDSLAVQRLLFTGRSINDLGNYQGCQALPSSTYYVVKYEINRVNFMIGVCAPDLCTKEDLTQVFGNLMQGYNFDIRQPDDTPLTPVGWFVIMIFILILTCAAAGSYLELKYNKLAAKGVNVRHSLANRILLSFSIPGNFLKLTQVNPAGSEVKPTDSLNGLRFISMLLIISGHVWAFRGDSAQRDLDRLPGLFSDKWLVYFMGYNGFYAVDTFFWLSAFLMVFVFCPMYEAKRCRIGVFGWAMVYVHRFMRIVPVYAAFIGFYFKVLPSMSEGPQWYTINRINTDCEEYWWTNLLFLTNFIPNGVGNDCFGIGWYLTNDMQLFYMAPILLLIFYTFSSMICWIVCVCLLILNMIITGIIVDENEFNTQFIHEKNWEGDWFNKVYGKPYTRLAPYVIGLLCGLIYVEYHREHSRDKLSKNISNFITRSSMHSTATFVIGAILTWFIVYIQQEPYAKMGQEDPWSQSTHTLYLSVHFVVYGIGLSLLLLPVLLGGCKFVRSLLGWRLFAPFARITFDAFLVHYGVVVGMFALREKDSSFDDITWLQDFISVNTLTWSLALLVALFIESPVIGISKILTGRAQ